MKKYPYYLYAMRKDDAFQHLMDAGGEGLCGAAAESWRMHSFPFPGVSLCVGCDNARDMKQAEEHQARTEAYLKAETERIRNFWLKEK